MVLPHFACGRQRCILLKSRADRILAKHRGGSWLSTPEYDHRVDTARRLWTARTRLRVQRTHIKGPAESRSGLGRSIVTMVQPADSLLRKDSTRSYGTNPAVRCSLLKSEMRAVLMMVTNILGEQSLQMAFIQRNNVVQEVSSAAPHPPLRDAILP